MVMNRSSSNLPSSTVVAKSSENTDTASAKSIPGWVDGGYYAPHLPVRTVRATFTAYSSRITRRLSPAHVDVIVAGFMYCYKVILPPIIVILVYVM
jgi:hypothetical protein